MPNRILKQSICTSQNINALSMGSERFFYRLLVQCDDFGQFFANPSILRGFCFPLQIEQTTEQQVRDWLDELIKAQLIWTYDVDGASYLQVTKWESHQQMRARRHKFPPPPACDIKSESNGMDLISHDINSNQQPSLAKTIQSNPIRIQSESNTKGAGAPPAKPAASNGNQPTPRQLALKELETKFSTITKLPPPKRETESQKSEGAKLWWTPLGELYDLVDHDVGRAGVLIIKAIEKLRADNMTFDSPKSLMKTARSIHANGSQQVPTRKMRDADGN